jgi:hypothetical protein
VTKHQFDADAAHHAAVALCATLVLFSLFGLAFMPFPFGSAVTSSRLIVVGWNLVLLAPLWLERKTPRLTTGLVGWGLAALPLVVVWWALIRVRGAHQHEWEPLLRQKAMFVVMALFAPPRLWLGLMVVAFLAADALLEYWVGGLARLPTLWTHEPWATLVACFIGMLLMLVRTRDLSRERQEVARIERLQATEEVARMSLAVRDLANTPLQALLTSLALLEKNCPAAHPFLPPMQRALDRLTELNALLRRYELPAGSAAVSLDSEALLGKKASGT